MKKKATIAVGAVALLAALILLSGCIVVTQQNEFSIVRQFGKVVSIRGDAGISFKVPLVQTVDKLPNTVLLYDLPISDVITQDKKTMVTDSFVLWRIEDPQLFIQSLNGNLPSAEARLSTNVYNAVKNVISARTQTDVISGRDGVLAGDIRESVGGTMSQYGIDLIAVETKHLDLPDDNKEAVYQRMISERNNIAASYTAQGESEATKIRSGTDREVEILVSKAKADAEIQIAEGEAEYMRILSSAYSDTSRADFYSFVRSLDAAKNSLTGGNKTLFLDKDSPLVKVFYNEG